jgi:ribosomal protein L14
MKRLLIILMAFLLGTSLKAQDTSSHKMHHQMKDCVMMKEGKMIQMKDGKEMEMKQDMTMSNGAVVMKNGNVKKKDGTTVMLKNGDCVMMDGTVKHQDMTKKKGM